MPADAIALGVNFNELTKKVTSIGIGGKASTYIEPSQVAFLDEDERRVYGYDINIFIYPPIEKEVRELPSLLGRDIINRWHITYDNSVPLLSAEVISADKRYTI